MTDALHAVGTFKAAAPEATIARVRDRFDALGIATIERHARVVDGHFASVQVVVPGTNVYANGKGIDLPFARASAHAELMERLQFLVYLRLRYPDERRVAATVVTDDLEALRAMWQAEGGVPLDETSLPYFHVNSGELALLPADSLRLSAWTNGTAAGNTVHEALVHALCEVIERDTLRRIYFERPSFPSVPVDDIAHLPQGSTIRYLRARGFDVIVKDCSTRPGWPVVGLILRRGRQGRLTIGVSPSFPIALERCLTEMFQGQSIERVADTMPGIPTEEEAASASPRARALRFIRSARNIEPTVDPCLLDSHGVYNHVMVQHPATDLVSRTAAERLVHRVVEEGHDLFVRDISFLGFPTVTVWVPALSTFNLPVFHAEAGTARTARVGEVYMKSDSATSEDLRLLAGSIVAWRDSPVRYPSARWHDDALGLEQGAMLPWGQLDPSIVAAILWYEAGEVEAATAAATDALSRWITKSPLHRPPPAIVEGMFRFKAFLDARAAGMGQGAAGERAFSGAPDPFGIAARLRGDIPRSAFLRVPPQCYQCATCDLASNCRVPARDLLLDRVAAPLARWEFDQRDLGSLIGAKHHG